MTCAVLARAVLGCATLGTVAAAPVPDLSATALYTATVHGCQAVDLATWHHPARAVLQAAEARVVKVELCNGDRFPVFTVALPYDAFGNTDDYFNRLYADLAEANGFWSYALVDVANGVVVTADVRRPGHDVSVSYEEFRRPAGTPRDAPGSGT